MHYGHACLTPCVVVCIGLTGRPSTRETIESTTDIRRTDALPVHYVFPRQRIDVALAAESLVEASQEEMAGPSGSGKKGVVVVWDVAIDWVSGEHALFAL